MLSDSTTWERGGGAACTGEATLAGEEWREEQAWRDPNPSSWGDIDQQVRHVQKTGQVCPNSDQPWRKRTSCLGLSLLL